MAIDKVFITQWGAEFAEKFQQTDSRLRNSVRVVSGVGAGYSFPRMETSSAVVGKSRHADLTPANTDMDRVATVTSTIHWADYVDDLDQARTNADVRAALTETGVAAVNRQVDTLIISALATSGNDLTSQLATANKLDSAGLINVAQNLNKADIPFGDRYAAISAGAINNITSDTKFTSRDYVTKGLMENGSVPGVLGFTMNFTNLLPNPSGSLKSNFFYHKNAVGLHIVEDLKMRVDYIPAKDAWQVMVKMALGCTIIRPEGVYFANITG